MKPAYIHGLMINDSNWAEQYMFVVIFCTLNVRFSRLLLHSYLNAVCFNMAVIPAHKSDQGKKGSALQLLAKCFGLASEGHVHWVKHLSLKAVSPIMKNIFKS